MVCNWHIKIRDILTIIISYFYNSFNSNIDLFTFPGRKRKRLSRKNTKVTCAKNVLRRIAKALNNCTLDNETMQKVLSLLTEHSMNKVSSSKIIRQSNEDKI